jgi:hypothetical protein
MKSKKVTTNRRASIKIGDVYSPSVKYEHEKFIAWDSS